jgi:hypothetical protein
MPTIARIAALIIVGLAVMPHSSHGAPAACASPVFEKRLIAAVTSGEAQLKSIPGDKLQDYARCYARIACASLSTNEFEMYALSAITSYGNDDRAETEYLNRMRRHRRENDAAGDKLPPKTLEATCKREIGLPQ